MCLITTGKNINLPGLKLRHPTKQFRSKWNIIGNIQAVPSIRLLASSSKAKASMIKTCVMTLRLPKDVGDCHFSFACFAYLAGSPQVNCPLNTLNTRNPEEPDGGGHDDCVGLIYECFKMSRTLPLDMGARFIN